MTKENLKTFPNFEDQKLTPMMKQYAEVKSQYEDCLLFYRLGDFFELFYEDAKIASKELGLVLTQRSGIPMCGVPWHAHEMYLTKLIKNGHRVAICEQTETPEEAKAKRGYKATVERCVVRVVTKGTLIESSLIEEKCNNFLLSFCLDKDKIGFAYVDISTGAFFVEESFKNDLVSVIEKISPSEIICAEDVLSNPEILGLISPYKSIIRPIPCAKLLQGSSDKKLADFYGVKFTDAFGKFSNCIKSSITLAIEYLSLVYINSKISLSIPKIINQFDFMQIDCFTRKSLELHKTLSGEKKGSLFYNIDRTETSQGGRLLQNWLSAPLYNVEKINKRLDFVEFFVRNKEILSDIKHILSSFPDIERAYSRISIGKTGPRDLNCVKLSLKLCMELDSITRNYTELKSLETSFKDMENIVSTLEEALKDEVPFLVRDGNFIKSGYDKELDEYRNILSNGSLIINTLQKKYVDYSGIPNLKIKNNNVLGYFIEFSAGHVMKAPYDFIHRQSLASVVRYTTEELSETAKKIHSAESDALRREGVIFEDLCRRISFLKQEIYILSQKISFLDCVTSLASLAIERGYVRPEIIDEKIIDIKKGRHPVVETELRKDGENFVANDCFMDDSSYISVLTGPNMGGKSTFLRQNAIIVIMAHIGSFVPAEKAVIGLTDKIFSRVGASDDISSGRSTFMVEMIETATILCQATEKSFVILDEIGRGTSTYDGLSIAKAVVESIHDDIKARTIFATHYHELIDLKNTINNVQYITVYVDETEDEITFMHKITKGFANKSYGIHVASIAGVPQKVIVRAKEILEKLNETIKK